MVRQWLLSCPGAQAAASYNQQTQLAGPTTDAHLAPSMQDWQEARSTHSRTPSWQSASSHDTGVMGPSYNTSDAQPGPDGGPFTGQPELEFADRPGGLMVSHVNSFSTQQAAAAPANQHSSQEAAAARAGSMTVAANLTGHLQEAAQHTQSRPPHDNRDGP